MTTDRSTKIERQDLPGGFAVLRPRLHQLAAFARSFALCTPGLIAFLFILLRNEIEGRPFEAVFEAVFVGFAVQVVVFIGFVFADVVAAKLIGDSKVSSFESPNGLRNLLTATLLATSVWIWWQYDRDTVVRRLAECVDQVVAETGNSPREAVLECYTTEEEGSVPE